MPLFGHKRSTSPSDVAAAPTTTAAANDPAYDNNTINTGRSRSIFSRNRNSNTNNVDDVNGYNNGYNGANGANGTNGVHPAHQIGNQNGYTEDEPRRSGSGGSFFSRSSRNASIDGTQNMQNIPASLNDAHSKLDAAVASERAADAALRDARLAVKDARDMVDRIEREARREADMASHKLREVRTMRKTAGGLGKFGTA
ncbi:hypothetical protein CALVIDRAFT_552747 [Calocera viscosa TUFC12733]|uniref:Uncharacterized protein n=1 Tax=Calocera viscosa (strain TUFC12733) TaxID=1330018 RepID=A0A167R235_CALVF|nr:hypothetical protein CALVIDRAFT_552747 [Calocera viscosa TUFC12733]